MHTASDRPTCPNPACASPHVVKNGRLKGVQRYYCRSCATWFSATTGTPLYRLHTPPAEIALALKIVMERGSLRAAERLTGHKYETISHWLHLAAEHAEALTEALVQDLELSTVEIDEFWSFVKKRVAASQRLTRPMPWPLASASATPASCATTSGAASCSIRPAGSW
jgi:transposase-like protein